MTDERRGRDHRGPDTGFTADRDDGSAAESNADIRLFAECWNSERFFDAHEALEPRWIATGDRGLRGLIQLAAAFHHLKNGNITGARTLLGRAISGLNHPDNHPCVISQQELAGYAARVLSGLEQAQPREIIDARPRL